MSDGISWLDVKLGVRMLAKSPGLSLVGGLGMAVAIAIGAGFFELTSEVLHPRLPVEDGDRVVAVQVWNARAANQERRILHDLAAWRTGLATVRELGAYRSVSRNLVIPGGQTEQVVLAEMTASGFGVARVPPLLGRTLVEDDERPGAPPVVVVGEDAWRTHFGADPAIIGRPVRLGHTVHTVVGVMPEGFGFPLDHRFWVPFRADPLDWPRGEGPGIHVFGRLAPGATMEQAHAEVAAAGARAAAAYPETHAHLRARVLPFTADNDLVDDFSAWMLHALRVVVSLLLVVICANVAVLVYARTARRHAEIAIRTALGASRRRIVAQLFAEALVLAAISAAAGLLVARIALDQLLTLLPPRGRGLVPFWLEFGLSWNTVAYVVALAVLAAVITGVLPALRATGPRLQSGLRALGGGAGGLRLGRTWTALIVVQVAIAVALLPAALYSTVDWLRYGLAEPGFAADEYLTVGVGMDTEAPPPGRAPAGDSARDARYAARMAALERRLEAEPAVSAVTLTRTVPGEEPVMWVEVEGVARPTQVRGGYAVREGTAGHQVRTVGVDTDYFATYEVPLLAGRGFRAADADTAATAVVVSRTFVREALGGGEALGRRIRYVGRSGDAPEGSLDPERWYEIVGVAADFPRAMGPNATMARVHHPLAPARMYPVVASVRVRGAGPAAFAPRFRALAAGVDPMLRLHALRPLDESLRDLQVMMRVTALSIGLVTLTVLLLSAAGVHALLSFTVSQRRREIGIRTALGAHPRQVLASVFARAFRQVGTGVAVGLALAALLTWALGSGMLGGPAVLLVPGVGVMMLLVGALAALGPARRGLRIHPMDALRDE